MENDEWEEKRFNQAIKDFHKEEVEKMNVPEWANVTCLHCLEKVVTNGIRKITVSMNAKNIGDASVEYHCDKCGILDTIFFSNAVKDIPDFSDYLIGKKEMTKEPIAEVITRKNGYNNLMNRFFARKKE